MSYKTHSFFGGDSPYITALISKKHLQNASVSNNNLTNTEFSPKSGSEPKYEPIRWNDNPKIKETHNCYSYALNSIVAARLNKPQPGYFAKYPHISNGNYTCDPFVKRLRKDIPSLYDTTFRGKCKKGFYKIYMAVTKDSPDTDYHFYRHDNNGYWSHKPGRTNITNLDASDNNQRTVPISSSAWPNRPIGVWSMIVWPRSVSSPVFSSVNRNRFCSVRKNPGAIAFTRISLE